MPANFPTFISEVTGYLSGKTASDEAAFALKLESSYITALSGATTSVGIPIIPPTPGPIASALLIDLNNAKLLEQGKMLPTAFNTTANAIVIASLIYAPPPHSTAFDTSGVSSVLSASLTAAFQSQSSAGTATALAAAFQAHLAVVSGTIILGTVTSPWIGIS